MNIRHLLISALFVASLITVSLFAGGRQVELPRLDDPWWSTATGSDFLARYQKLGYLIAKVVTKNGHALPDPNYTPGAARPLTTSQVCKIKWGKDERHVDLALKKRVCAEYGISEGCPGPKYEIDHLISRELAGADEIGNLWPEPQPDAHVKDVVENRLHREVCAGKRTLAEAQSVLSKDWTQAIE